MIITRQRLPFLFLLPYPYHYDTANYKAMTTLNTKKYKKQSIGGNFMDTQKSIEHFDYCYEKASSIFEEVRKVIIDKETVLLKVLMTILAKGHVLIDDVPGVGKTTLAVAFSKALHLEYHRLQFTPDILPSDIVGFSIYNKKTEDFEYKKGAAFCNLFLADEINRTSPKSQSALLELMEEGQVSIDGVTHVLPNPFFVIATQNPIGSIGTQLLPESQMDRFMSCLSMGYPSVANEIEILKGREYKNPLDEVQAISTIDDLLLIQSVVEKIYISDPIYQYIVNLANATRNHPMIRIGISPRGSLALMRMAKSAAFLKERDFVVPEDIKLIFSDVCAHRIVLDPKTKASGMTSAQVLSQILKNVNP